MDVVIPTRKVLYTSSTRRKRLKGSRAVGQLFAELYTRREMPKQNSATGVATNQMTRPMVIAALFSPRAGEQRFILRGRAESRTRG
jgi:hypothetical protein